MTQAELLEYKVEQIDKIMVGVVNNYDQIYNNISSIEKCLEAIKDRIIKLEEDLNDRKLKTYFYKLLMFFYPLLLAVLVFIVKADHETMLTTLKEVQGLMGYTLL